MQIRLNNSLTRKIENFKPIDGDTVRMYSCGPTVYNYAHIGNMRAFLFADLLQRILKIIGGYEVKWVMNITDIDDKTIRDSALGSSAWLPAMGEQVDNPMHNLMRFTDYYKQAFMDDITDLGIKLKDITEMPRATSFILPMQNLIKKIIDQGIGYIAEGSVYFNVAKWRERDVYGKLHKIDFENFRSGERVDSDQYEREQVSDFVIWKARREDEPYWDFDIDGENYPGRPGWHIECSAMEHELLGLPFDIHTGGIDLKFPHHEDEIAQSKAGYGIDPTVFWCHNEFLEVEGEKMSKSLGNYYTLRDLEHQGLDPLDIRFAMLSSHYGSKYNFTFDGIEASHKARQRVQEYIHELHENGNEESLAIEIDDIRKKVFSLFADDLHTPKALGELFSFINKYPADILNRESKDSLIEFFKELNDIFGIWQISQRPEEQLIIPQEIIDLADRRIQARKDKNFSEADELRDKIQEAGYIVKDTKDTYVIEKA